MEVKYGGKYGRKPPSAWNQRGGGFLPYFASIFFSAIFGETDRNMEANMEANMERVALEIMGFLSLQHHLGVPSRARVCDGCFLMSYVRTRRIVSRPIILRIFCRKHGRTELEVQTISTGLKMLLSVAVTSIFLVRSSQLLPGEKHKERRQVTFLAPMSKTGDSEFSSGPERLQEDHTAPLTPQGRS